MNNCKLVSFIFTVLAAGLNISCVSMQDRTMTHQEAGGTEIIDTVSVEFTSYQLLHIHGTERIKQKAYTELKKTAAAQYGENIDVKNIVIQGKWSVWEILNAAAGLAAGVGGGALYWFTLGERWAARYQTPVLITSFGVGALAGSLLAGNTQKVTASGDVVESRQRSNTAVNIALGKAVNKIAQELASELPEKSSVAVISVSSTNNAKMSTLVVDELEYYLVNTKKFIMVDRKTLDTIRDERNLQMSGDVSDASAVSIGHMLGAHIVITGNITESGSTQRLSIRALDVETSRIITMARETF